MKSKDRFFVNEDFSNVHAKKKDKFGNSHRGLVTDKFGNSIRIGDFVQTTLKDGTILSECEVVEMSNGNVLTLVLEDGETTKEVPASKVILLSI